MASDIVSSSEHVSFSVIDIPPEELEDFFTFP